MIERMKTLFSKKVTVTSPAKPAPKFETYVENFFAHPFHYWILKDRYTKATFEELLEILPKSAQKFLMNNPPLVFVQSTGKYSCAISTSKSHAIIIFPELANLLKSTMMDHSLAILLHEVGHIIQSHGNAEIDPMQAQIEADTFAANLGFGKFLEDFLLDQPESMEKRVRLSNLTKLELTKNARENN